MEKPLLKDPDIFPNNEVLKATLKQSYKAFEMLMSTIAKPDYALIPEWRYYNDGKAWLCKVCFKKKTVFWLSVWEGHFKTGFYFTERFVPGIMGLGIDQSIKDDFSNSKPIGKLKPLTISVFCEDQIKDVLTVAEFKKDSK